MCVCVFVFYGQWWANESKRLRFSDLNINHSPSALSLLCNIILLFPRCSLFDLKCILYIVCTVYTSILSSFYLKNVQLPLIQCGPHILGPLFFSPSFNRLFFFCPVAFDSSRPPSDVLLTAPHQEEEPKMEIQDFSLITTLYRLWWQVTSIGFDGDWSWMCKFGRFKFLMLCQS